MQERILLVEDDASLRETVELDLEQEGFRVVSEADGRRALQTFISRQGTADAFDLVLLDVMLPPINGQQVCREIRARSRVPIIMISARTDAVDVVVGLDAGADDYVKKPFELPELVARIRATFRRVEEIPSEEPLHLGDLEVEPNALRARKAGKEVPLTATELRLLLEMARHPGQVFTRDLLLERVWGHERVGDSRMVDMAMQRLRRKVEDDPAHPRLIMTVRGLGYRIADN